MIVVLCVGDYLFSWSLCLVNPKERETAGGGHCKEKSDPSHPVHKGLNSSKCTGSVFELYLLQTHLLLSDHSSSSSSSSVSLGVAAASSSADSSTSKAAAALVE